MSSYIVPLLQVLVSHIQFIFIVGPFVNKSLLIAIFKYILCRCMHFRVREMNP
jgi:hypothetical protein